MLKAVNQLFEALNLLHEQMVDYTDYCFGYLIHHWVNGNTGVLDQGCSKSETGRFLLYIPPSTPDNCINLAYSFLAMIKPETIQRIIDTARIEEVIGDFVSLKKRGSNYLGLCPFHNEKTPSFSVSPAKGIYKCFGCGKAGNSVNFIIEHEHYSYPEALKYIAKKYNIEVEEEEVTPEMQQEIDVHLRIENNDDTGSLIYESWAG